MTEFATAVLPFGVAIAGVERAGGVRLVLTGTGGGTWEVPLDGGGAVQRAGQALHPASPVTVVVDTAMFCRVVANRSDLERSGAVTMGDIEGARALFLGASALAFD
jgi:hypothetical protein